MFMQTYSEYSEFPMRYEDVVYGKEYITFTLGSVVQILEKKFVAYCASVSKRVAIAQLDTKRKQAVRIVKLCG
jgi:hypothetical protein